MLSQKAPFFKPFLKILIFQKWQKHGYKKVHIFATAQTRIKPEKIRVFNGAGTG